MNPRQFPTIVHAKTDGHTTGGDQRVYGLVEWDGSYRPTVIVGCCRPAVLRDIVAIITGWAADGGQLGSDEFQQQHPLPDPNAPAEVLADWLHARIDAAVPYVTLVDPAELVHTGDPLIIVNRLAANPCCSALSGRRTPTGSRRPRRLARRCSSTATRWCPRSPTTRTPPAGSSSAGSPDGCPTGLAAPAGS
jgi:hypothetical protein